MLAFFTNMIEYHLCLVICPDRFEVASHTTGTISILKNPTTQALLRLFIVICNFIFHSFVPTSACITTPLTAQLQEDHPN